jgi:hypothetical protein
LRVIRVNQETTLLTEIREAWVIRVQRETLVLKAI